MAELVRTLERGDPPRVIPFGDGFVEARLPVGTRVIYPQPPLQPIPDPDAAIRQALQNGVNDWVKPRHALGN